jgi:hypothetical protein
MSSIIRIDSNRRKGAKSRGPTTPEGKEISAANAAHSTGPRTPEGKARVSQNALRHGILAKTVVLPTECARTYQQEHAALTAELQPCGYIDGVLIDAMHHAHWRRKRAWFVEQDLLTNAVESQDNQENSEKGASPIRQTALAFTSVSDRGGTLKNVRRYEISYSREFLRNLLAYESRRRAKAVDPVITKQTEPKAG